MKNFVIGMKKVVPKTKISANGRMGCCESINEVTEEITIPENCIINIVRQCRYEPIVSKLSIMILNRIESFPYISVTAISLSAKFLCDERISLSALADLVGISRRKLSNMESNVLKNINWNLWKFTKIIIQNQDQELPSSY